MSFNKFQFHCYLCSAHQTSQFKILFVPKFVFETKLPCLDSKYTRDLLIGSIHFLWVARGWGGWFFLNVSELFCMTPKFFLQCPLNPVCIPAWTPFPLNCWDAPLLARKILDALQKPPPPPAPTHKNEWSLRLHVCENKKYCNVNRLTKCRSNSTVIFQLKNLILNLEEETVRRLAIRVLSRGVGSLEFIQSQLIPEGDDDSGPMINRHGSPLRPLTVRPPGNKKFSHPGSWPTLTLTPTNSQPWSWTRTRPTPITSQTQATNGTYTRVVQMWPLSANAKRY